MKYLTKLNTAEALLTTKAKLKRDTQYSHKKQRVASKLLQIQLTLNNIGLLVLR